MDGTISLHFSMTTGYTSANDDIGDVVDIFPLSDINVFNLLTCNDKTKKWVAQQRFPVVNSK